MATTSQSYYLPKRPDTPAEDRTYVRNELAVVADGVTRIPPPGEMYPSPSPAAVAAQILVTEVGRSQASQAADLVVAMIRANSILRGLNEACGWSSLFTARVDDLAGTVGASAVVTPSVVEWAYIADCGVAVLDAVGGLRHITQDDIEPMRRLFPSANLPAYDRMWRIRDRFRNTNRSPSFGVFTGEPSAAQYVRSGSWPLTGGDAVVVFSDGCRPLLGSPVVRAALVRGNEQTDSVLKSAAAAYDLTDEVSAAVLRSSAANGATQRQGRPAALQALPHSRS